LVDDANRISRFAHIVDLLQNQRPDQKIKVIATLRDYALDAVQEAASSYGAWTKVELHPLEEKEIKQLVEEECGILNNHYQDRIADIAGGKYGYVDSLLVIRHGQIGYERTYKHDYDRIYGDSARTTKVR